MQIHKSAAILAIACAGTTAVPAPPAGSREGSKLSQLSWLAGCLEMRSGDRITEEHRMGVRGASMLGMARTTSSKGLVEYELTLIREKAGKIVFEARPSGQPAAEFSATVAGRDSVVFAAPEHDYPQFVGYRRAGADSIIAWIDGHSAGKPRRVEFRYRRVPCTATQTRAEGSGR